MQKLCAKAALAALCRYWADREQKLWAEGALVALCRY
jgi:hypothetical protein